MLRQERASADEVIQKCLKFCNRSLEMENFEYLRNILQFIHEVNTSDHWLIETATFVLPTLYQLYCQILTKADSSVRTERGEVMVSITSNVKNNRGAVRALSVVLELSVDFSDTESAISKEQMKKFIRASAAILFGSHLQIDDCYKTLSPEEYAVDELVRHASFALSNILLSFTTLIPAAEGFLAKRLNSLFKFLGSAAELSVQRSLIIVLKMIYDNERGSGGNCSVRDLIEQKIRNSEMWDPDSFAEFKKMKVADGPNVMAKDEVMKTLLEGNVSLLKCFSTIGCKVQLKRPDQKRGSAFKSASVDWNLNSIVVHFGDDRSIYYPMFTIDKAEWKRNNRDLWIRFNSWGDFEGVEVVVRFGADFDEEKGSVIHDRLSDVSLMTPVNIHSKFHVQDAKEKSRNKNSTAVNRLGPEADLSLINEEDDTTFGEREKNRSAEEDSELHEDDMDNVLLESTSKGDLEKYIGENESSLLVDFGEQNNRGGMMRLERHGPDPEEGKFGDEISKNMSKFLDSKALDTKGEGSRARLRNSDGSNAGGQSPDDLEEMNLIDQAVKQDDVDEQIAHQEMKEGSEDNDELNYGEPSESEQDSDENYSPSLDDVDSESDYSGLITTQNNKIEQTVQRRKRNKRAFIDRAEVVNNESIPRSSDSDQAFEIRDKDNGEKSEIGSQRVIPDSVMMSTKGDELNQASERIISDTSDGEGETDSDEVENNDNYDGDEDDNVDIDDGNGGGDGDGGGGGDDGGDDSVDGDGGDDIDNLVEEAEDYEVFDGDENEMDLAIDSNGQGANAMVESRDGQAERETSDKDVSSDEGWVDYNIVADKIAELMVGVNEVRTE